MARGLCRQNRSIVTERLCLNEILILGETNPNINKRGVKQLLIVVQSHDDIFLDFILENEIFKEHLLNRGLIYFDGSQSESGQKNHDREYYG